jgi:predicted DNA-binding protein (MmcQ/YjbR family)
VPDEEIKRQIENSYDLIKPKVKRRRDSACHVNLLEED